MKSDWCGYYQEKGWEQWSHRPILLKPTSVGTPTDKCCKTHISCVKSTFFFECFGKESGACIFLWNMFWSQFQFQFNKYCVVFNWTGHTDRHHFVVHHEKKLGVKLAMFGNIRKWTIGPCTNCLLSVSDVVILIEALEIFAALKHPLHAAMHSFLYRLQKMST